MIYITWMLVKETDPTTSGHFEQVKFVMFASNCVPTVSIGNPNITTVTDSGQITLFVWLKKLDFSYFMLIFLISAAKVQFL